MRHVDALIEMYPRTLLPLAPFREHATALLDMSPPPAPWVRVRQPVSRARWADGVWGVAELDMLLAALKDFGQGGPSCARDAPLPGYGQKEEAWGRGLFPSVCRRL
ncbi:hypothetical protein DPEC_G00320090 [Dallia pectoralis]|uniref:Uncharacterized protein n=1 Tax=Dallia pectoralis TaxID=75939 RepID=A0ACC2F9Z6_DALPE|nr:hypothetical protein DPEC_G00320090 [Dallia pectoralis]